MSESLRATIGLDEHELDEVLALLAASDVVELDVAYPGGRLSLRRARGAPALPPQSDGVDGIDLTARSPFLAVTSPLVGIFRPAVHTGEHVADGQALGAIEALGMPTSVDAPAAGLVEELLVAEGGPAEFGQTLLVLRLDARP